jgi:hypothetical protein
VQKPAEKINHALLLGGAQGIGKDTILAPVKHAVGPWNFAEVSPLQMMGRFNGFLKSRILRVSELRDLGSELSRFSFYEHTKTLIAAPPDVLRVDEKHAREIAVPNVVGVIFTTNSRDAIYLPEDDRRHFVAWSELTKDDFTEAYWKQMWEWYEAGGYGHVAAHLTKLDISSFNPNAPPPRTDAFWQIVDINRAPEHSELADVLDLMSRPAATTIADIIEAARTKGVFESDLARWLGDRANRRAIPHRLEACGYVSVRNPDAKDKAWVVRGSRVVVYAQTALTVADRHRAAADLVR